MLFLEFLSSLNFKKLLTIFGGGDNSQKSVTSNHNIMCDLLGRKRHYKREGHHRNTSRRNRTISSRAYGSAYIILESIREIFYPLLTYS